IIVAIACSCVERKPERLARQESPVSTQLKEMVALQDEILLSPNIDPRTKMDSMMSFRRQTMELISQALVREPEDQYQAALILQAASVATGAESCLMGHYLAVQAAEKGHEKSRFLAAAAYDRYLVHTGQVQKYGTQYLSDSAGDMSLYPVDSMTSDSERVAWGVLPLDQLLEQIKLGKSE
ncbi:MAG: hypothetical protein GY867_09400, partial [bacterium]|nr:hypothetical protein [bacterium]